MAPAVISSTGRTACEPLYDFDPQTGASIEVFYADRVLAKAFGRESGWFWWSCQSGFLPDGEPTGPFATSYAAYRDALDGGKQLFRERPTYEQSFARESAKL